VTGIGREAFSRCGSLTSITLPDRIDKIRSMTFYECKNLTEVSIPESVEEMIVPSAFAGCENLKQLTFRQPGGGTKKKSASKWKKEEINQ
jgi:hypothetical protein